MESIDRLDWAAGISLTAHGARIGIRATRPEAISKLVETLPPVWRPSKSPVVDRMYSLVVAPPVRQRGRRHFNVLYADSARIARSEGMAEVLRSLDTDAQLVISELATRLLFVHAGVVTWKGRALLLPAASHTGKSTLVAALVRAGATYFSDEFAMLDPAGRVHQYRAPISLRTDVAGEFADVLPACRAPGRSRPPAPVAATAFLRHEEGARLHLRQVSPGEAILGLVENTIAARRRPGDTLRVHRQVAAGCGLHLRGVRGDAAAAAARLLEELDRLP